MRKNDSAGTRTMLDRRPRSKTVFGLTDRALQWASGAAAGLAKELRTPTRGFDAKPNVRSGMSHAARS
jgi:hypothetical protein